MPKQLPALFIADSKGLDFLNSVATPTDTAIDWLSDGEGLLAWLEQGQLVPTEVIAGMRRQAKPAELERVAEQARSLREWFRAFVFRHRGKSLKAADLAELEPLNELLERDAGLLRLVVAKRGKANAIELVRARRWRTSGSLLVPVGEALAQLVANEDFADVKACEGPACTLMFADHTRGRSRRWCSMAICGNRAKQAAHRRRLSENR